MSAVFEKYNRLACPLHSLNKSRLDGSAGKGFHRTSTGLTIRVQTPEPTEKWEVRSNSKSAPLTSKHTMHMRPIIHTYDEKFKEIQWIRDYCVYMCCAFYTDNCPRGKYNLNFKGCLYEVMIVTIYK